MKTVIDAIHEDIQNRSRSEQETTSPQSSRHGSSHSSRGEQKNDSREMKRIESFLVDAAKACMPAASIEGDIDEEEACRHIAENMDEIDEEVEGAGKNKAT